MIPFLRAAQRFAVENFATHAAKASMNFMRSSRVVSFVILPFSIEQFRSTPNVCFRLLHGGNIQKYERLPEMMICAEAAYCARRNAYHCTGLPFPDALAVWP